MIDIPDEKVINSSRDDSDTPDTTYHTIDERGPLVPASFTSYSEFVRWYNNKEPHLYDQREILAAIVFEEGATKLPTLVNPKKFDYRGPSDWQENPGGYERIAVVAFDYWEDHASVDGGVLPPFVPAVWLRPRPCVDAAGGSALCPSR